MNHVDTVGERDKMRRVDSVELRQSPQEGGWAGHQPADEAAPARAGLLLTSQP